MKNRTKKGKIVVKKWGFRGLKGGNWEQKNASWRPSRKAKWCKMQAVFLKMD